MVFRSKSVAMRGDRRLAVILALTLLAGCSKPVPRTEETGTGNTVKAAWSVPDITVLADDAHGQMVRRGHDLIAQTLALLGPEVADPARRFAGNNLNCQSCHLDAGTRQFALPLVGVVEDFPKYRARSGKVNTIEDRINGCLMRSMNGRALPSGDADMAAMVSYLTFLSSGRKAGEEVEGRGLPRIPELSRAANPVRGKVVYLDNCVACHGNDGRGKRAGTIGDAKGYAYPPLWGPDSYNNGAGMARLITAANFVHANMPLGANWQATALSDADAWDVAAYINSQPRPQMAGLDKDYPKRTEKPVDAGYGPWVDNFPAEQHRLGPFALMRKNQP